MLQIFELFPLSVLYRVSDEPSAAVVIPNPNDIPRTRAAEISIFTSSS